MIFWEFRCFLYIKRMYLQKKYVNMLSVNLAFIQDIWMNKGRKGQIGHWTVKKYNHLQTRIDTCRKVTSPLPSWKSFLQSQGKGHKVQINDRFANHRFSVKLFYHSSRAGLIWNFHMTEIRKQYYCYLFFNKL